ncbi:MAG: DUF928 domain-containing protein [Chlorogloea purpurea SAG 13.99]|jgi:hypothetical protein|nr:DUF928 domain-containing protein [Chlorogloea purpurea SAG 13.99]
MITIFLSLSTLAQAGYVPPTSQKPPSDYSRSTGIRSGCQNQKPGEMLVIVAPQTYVGETTSVLPQFTWWTAVPSAIDFRLFEFTADGEVKKIGKPMQIQSVAGINRLSLPAGQPPLTVGQKYLWQVALRCPSGEYILERAEFKVVPAPSGLNQDELKSLDAIERYAQRGFWYDAFSESLLVSTSGKSGKLCSALISSLAASEAPGNEGSSTNNRQKSLEEISRDWCF